MVQSVGAVALGLLPGQRWGGKGHIRKAAWLKDVISLWAVILYQHRLGDNPSASGDHPSLPAYSIFFQVRGVGEGTLRVVRETLALPAQWGGEWGSVLVYLMPGRGRPEPQGPRVTGGG